MINISYTNDPTDMPSNALAKLCRPDMYVLYVRIEYWDSNAVVRCHIVRLARSQTDDAD